MSNADDDYRNIVVPDLDDDGDYRRPERSNLSGKFGYTAVGISILAIASQVAAPLLGIPPTVWAYFPFLWILAGAVGLWGMFADDRKSLDLFAIVGSVVFGIPTIILSIDLLSQL